jgi:transcription antitermination protein NusB
VITRRRRAREAAVETLYRCDLLHDDSQQTLADVLKRRHMPERSAEYCRRLVTRILEENAKIDETLSATLIHWKLERLSYLDRAILRLACCELLYVDDVPTTVSINEAVELAKLFGDDKSAQFVNGVLDAIAKAHPRGDSGQKQPRKEPTASGERQKSCG